MSSRPAGRAARALARGGLTALTALTALAAPAAAVPSAVQRPPAAATRVVAAAGADTLQSVAFGGGGDGGPALSADAHAEDEAVADAAGNTYLRTGYRVRRIDGATGRITTVVGSGHPGTGTDGGPALGPVLQGDEQVLVTPAGDVLFRGGPGGDVWRVEAGRLRRLTTNEFFSSIALGPDGTVFATRSFPNGPAPAGTFALTPGSTAPTRVSSVSDAVRVAADGSWYTSSDSGPGSVLRLDPATGASVLVAGGGSAAPVEGAPATSVRLGVHLTGLLPTGRLVVATAAPPTVWVVTDSGTLHQVYRGAPGSVTPPLRGVLGDDVLVSPELATHPVLLRLAGDGSEPETAARTVVAGLSESPDGTPAVDAFGGEPHRLARDTSGRLLVLTRAGLRQVDDQGRLQTLLPLPPGVLWQSDLSAAPDGSIYLLEEQVATQRDQVRRLWPDGSSAVVAGGGTGDPDTADGVPATGLALTDLTAVAALDGTVYLARYRDPGSQSLYAVRPDGTWRRVAGFPGLAPPGTLLGTSLLRINGLEPDSARHVLTLTGPTDLQVDLPSGAFRRVVLGSPLPKPLPAEGVLRADEGGLSRYLPDGRRVRVLGGDVLPRGVADVLPDADGGATLLQTGSWEAPAEVRRLPPAPLPAQRVPSPPTVTPQIAADGTVLVRVTAAALPDAETYASVWVDTGAPDVPTSFSWSSWSPPSVLLGGLRRERTYVFGLAVVTRDGSSGPWATTTVTLSPSQGAPTLIDAAYGRAGGPAGVLGPATSAVYAVRGGFARDFAGGRVYTDGFAPAREVHGAILGRYLAAGGPDGLLGLPVTDELTAPDRVGRSNDFASGATIAWSPVSGAHQLAGGVKAAWYLSGGFDGALGYPSTEETGPADLRQQDFSRGGTVCWTPTTGAHGVLGAIRQRWLALGGAAVLGVPTTDELAIREVTAARYSSFARGASLYWSPTTGAHAVYGAVRDRWLAAGGPQLLGLPTTDELTAPGGRGRYNDFRGGASVYWSPATGAHAVYGAIRVRWGALGGSTSYLGLPLSDEYAVPGGRRSDFEHGRIVWTPSGGAVDSR